MIEFHTLTVDSRGHTDVIDITAKVAACVKGDAIAVVFVSGLTAGITTIEYEHGLVKDIREAWEKIAPEKADPPSPKRS
jgi:thiamine phosphate synthase YjbQ (UPF0047 family)